MPPFDTSVYEQRRCSSFIYEPLFDESGIPVDFRIIYASELFLSDWRKIYNNDSCIGALLGENKLMDEHSLALMKRFVSEKPFPFASYIPSVNMNLCFEPIEGLPSPCGGFSVLAAQSQI